MELGLGLEVIWHDDATMLLRISAWNGSFGGSADVYVSTDMSRYIAALLGFPRSVSDVRELRFSDFGPDTAGGAARLNFHCVDGAGHARVDREIESDHNDGGPRESVNLFIELDTSAMDVFVSEFQELNSKKHGRALLRSGRS